MDAVDPTTRADAPIALFITCALSHIAIIPSTLLFWRRRWLYEASFSAFGLWCSFMYHTCQAFNTELFLTELQWHLLDNIFVIIGFVNLFTYMSCLKGGKREFFMKIAGCFLALVTQVRAPWEISHTVVPIVSYGIVPFFYVIFVRRRLFQWWDMKKLTVGLGLLAIAVPFFILGLDDAHDPFRMFHGLWHVFIGGSSYYMWQVVKSPSASNLQYVIFADSSAAGYAMLNMLRPPLRGDISGFGGIHTYPSGGIEEGIDFSAGVAVLPRQFAVSRKASSTMHTVHPPPSCHTRKPPYGVVCGGESGDVCAAKPLHIMRKVPDSGPDACICHTCFKHNKTEEVQLLKAMLKFNFHPSS